MSIQRTKAVIDALAEQTVTNEKAEAIVRLYVNNNDLPVSELTEFFLRSVTSHIKMKCRENAGKRWEDDRASKAAAMDQGYDEMPSAPQPAEPEEPVGDPE